MLKPFQIAGVLFLSMGAATIVTTRSAVKVYPNPIRRVFEQPLFVLDKGEVVEVIEWGNPLTKIRNRKGRVGYAESALLDSLRRPPILRLVIDSEPTVAKPSAAANDKPAKAATVPVVPQAPAANDTAVVTRKWASTPDTTATKSPEKPVVFQADTAHITPRLNNDSAKN